MLPDFWLGTVNFKNVKYLKKISEELIPVVWHPKRWWSLCMSDDEKKEIKPIFKY